MVDFAVAVFFRSYFLLILLYRLPSFLPCSQSLADYSFQKCSHCPSSCSRHLRHALLGWSSIHADRQIIFCRMFLQETTGVPTFRKI